MVKAHTGLDPFIGLLRAMGLPEPVTEYRFCPDRRWRFDYAWVERSVALEYEGGSWTGGRHTSGRGYSNDCEKYSVAAIMGWRVVRVTSDMVKSGLALTLVERALKEVQR